MKFINDDCQLNHIRKKLEVDLYDEDEIELVISHERTADYLVSTNETIKSVSDLEDTYFQYVARTVDDKPFYIIPINMTLKRKKKSFHSLYRKVRGTE